VVVIFVLGEFECHGTLANATGAFNKKCGFSIGNGLPLEHLAVDFTLEHRGSSPLNIPKFPENAKCFRLFFPEIAKCFCAVFPENAKSLAA
jgi:hypothetical protein